MAEQDGYYVTFGTQPGARKSNIGEGKHEGDGTCGPDDVRIETKTYNGLRIHAARKDEYVYGKPPDGGGKKDKTGGAKGKKTARA